MTPKEYTDIMTPLIVRCEELAQKTKDEFILILSDLSLSTDKGTCSSNLALIQTFSRVLREELDDLTGGER